MARLPREPHTPLRQEVVCRNPENHERHEQRPEENAEDRCADQPRHERRENMQKLDQRVSELKAAARLQVARYRSRDLTIARPARPCRGILPVKRRELTIERGIRDLQIQRDIEEKLAAHGKELARILC